MYFRPELVNYNITSPVQTKISKIMFQTSEHLNTQCGLTNISEQDSD